MDISSCCCLINEVLVGSCFHSGIQPFWRAWRVIVRLVSKSDSVHSGYGYFYPF